MEQGLGFLSSVDLPTSIAKPLSTLADGQIPIASDLEVFVAGLETSVVEGVLLLVLRSLCPYQSLMGIAESHSPELRHRIGLDPSDIIENPIAEIL